MKNDTLTREQLSALESYAGQHGRTWKHQLWHAWMNGTCYGELMQIRNQFGPTWLTRFNLKAAVAGRRAIDRANGESE
ncbi:MAG TPA: hypothetical protein VMQ86_25570 [Bryobacteraceae bacterium]|jgi:hypothetical protein|nr:hypothetical protein [Bryobacteraceae bacterium]